ncbi:MAG: bifunctional metallophosphatase/5'-nucleotidase [Lachnospiraceae bacterium]|nr:bifunctional metallophosphatase/5'-nucleotidase [Lachnospiraceae bacterium]
MKNRLKQVLTFLLAGTFLFAASCTGQGDTGSVSENTESTEPAAMGETGQDTPDNNAATDSPASNTPAAAGSGDIVILYTSDVHCAIDSGFGYAGLYQLRETLELNGDHTILVDNGDAVQGASVGTLTRGGAIIDLMNEVGYDIAIPGNHEFDYGMDRFLELTEMADFPYISCNFNKEGELVFDPYIIKEVNGVKIGFVGVTTPSTPTTSTPKYFQNEEGEYIYGFLQDETGSKLYDAVQMSVDAARTEGADYVIVMGHLGDELIYRPYTYKDVIENTEDFDVLIDGHSHDKEQVEMKNKAGNTVVRSACGTKLEGIGYVRISAEDGSLSTGLYTWENETSLPELMRIENSVSARVEEKKAELADLLNEVVASTSVDLVINDPEAVGNEEGRVRIIRRQETNLGDLCADAYREQTGADIALINAGGIRDDIMAGDITYSDIISIHPYGNMICVVDATGQQIIDALEWGARSLPDENGAFLQVSGLSYEIDMSVESSCTCDADGMFTGVEGPYRVKNVMVGGEPIDPDRTYMVASHSYLLKENGDGYTMFDDAPMILDEVILDNQVLINYITRAMDGVVGEQYADPYGEGRIVILE